MLFATDSIIKARQALYEQVEAGTLTREQAFRQALQLDPFDAVALIVVAEERFEAGDLAAAAEYYWRAASADPCRFDPWFRLCASLPGESRALLDGLMELGALKTLRNPESIERFEKVFKNSPEATDFAGGAEALEIMADELYEKRRDEPEELSQRLRPHRLADDLLEEAEEGLDEDLVDAILEDGARCLPLLIGVLRAMATESLPGDDPAPVVCSLALLGEIGDTAVLPDLIECYAVNDVDIQGTAHWAVKRIASRRPEAAIDAIRRVAPAAAPGDRCRLAMALADIPKQPGRRDALLSLLDGLATFPKADRHELFMAVAMALELSEGAKGRELAWSLLSRHAAILPKRTRGELRGALEDYDALDRIAPIPSDPEPTVYYLCGPVYGDDEDDEDDEDEEEEEDDGNPFDDEDDDEEDEDGQDFIPEPVRRTVTLGRNDPCWCGSGKKYKKCHLDSDEKSPPPADPRETPPPGINVAEGELRGRLMEFGTSALRKREVEESLQTFVGPDQPAGVDDDSLAREALDWMIHDYVPPRLGHPVIQEFLKRNPGGLTMRQRKILEAWSRSRYSLFEVQEVRRGLGVQVKDLLAGDEFFVYDVSTSRWAARWDCCLARAEEFEGRHEFTAVVLHLLQPDVAPLKEWAIDAQRRSGLSWDAFLRANSHKLRQEASRAINRASQRG